MASLDLFRRSLMLCTLSTKNLHHAVRSTLTFGELAQLRAESLCRYAIFILSSYAVRNSIYYPPGTRAQGITQTGGEQDHDKEKGNPELEISFYLPSDLSKKEISRIANFLQTLPFDDAELRAAA